jgi:hypothetical protein
MDKTADRIRNSTQTGVENSIARARRLRIQARKHAARLAARHGLLLLLGVLCAAILVWIIGEVLNWPGAVSSSAVH